MFEDEEFSVFVSSRTASTSLSFPLRRNPNSISDAFYSHPQLHLRNLQQQSTLKINGGGIANAKLLERDGSILDWSSDEVLALLEVRFSIESANWQLSDVVNWEYVSRKLGEIGYKRSARHCKERFEEESRHFNYRNHVIFRDEFDAFYPPGDVDGKTNQETSREISKDLEKLRSDGIDVHGSETVGELNRKSTGFLDDRNRIRGKDDQETSVCQESEKTVPKLTEDVIISEKRKRKRSEEYEMFRGFCEGIVRKMISQLEEVHNKLMDEMLKRDREMAECEETRRRQEADRIRAEDEIKSLEQAATRERQAEILKFLRRFASSESDQNFSDKIKDFHVKMNHAHFSPPQDKAELSSRQLNPSSEDNPIEIHAPSFSVNKTPPEKCSVTSGAPGNGKRWPRNEVLMLINLRCKLSGGTDHEANEAAVAKGSLWERISLSMLESGYSRSAKRCKEKWENINKYFRKTRDRNKKRSMDSTTCPYFHQLSSLYTS